jgi:hypothetical protein
MATATASAVSITRKERPPMETLLYLTICAVIVVLLLKLPPEL